ncbi:MAG: tetratricopeptide repeat protein [Chitinivibrionales bacterium]|nr:tetratricopeptide repeat protein [Chitinivibrionales bacterium]
MESVDLKERISELRKKYAANPRDVDCAQELAQLCADQGWLNEAADIYAGVLAHLPKSYSLLLEYGNVCYRSGDIEKALNAFRTLTTLKPKRIEGWNNLGIVYLRKKEFEKAREALEHVLAIEPDNTGALLNMGNCHQHQNDFDRAIDYFKSATASQIDFPDGWYNLGNCYNAGGEFAKAIGAYAKALRYQPEFGSAYKNMGFACEQLEKYDDALEHYQRALLYNKADAGLYVNIANVHVALKNFQKAKELYLRSTRLAPRSPAGWMGLRQLALLKGDILTYYNSTRAVASHLSVAEMTETVRTLRRIGKFEYVDEIIAVSAAVEKDDPELDAEILVALGRRGDQPGMVVALQKKLHAIAYPGNSIKECLGAFYLQQKQYHKAIGVLSAIEEKHVYVLKNLWEAYLNVKQFDRAEESIKKHLCIEPDFHECWLYLARLYAEQELEEKAGEALMNALQSGYVEDGFIQGHSKLRGIYKNILSAAEHKATDN